MFMQSSEPGFLLHLEQEEEVRAALIVVYITGVHPTTDFLKDSGIKMSSDGYVLVDKVHLKIL